MPDRVPDEARRTGFLKTHIDTLAKLEAAESRLSGLPDAFKAEFPVGVGLDVWTDDVLRWLEEQAGKEKG